MAHICLCVRVRACVSVFVSTLTDLPTRMNACIHAWASAKKKTFHLSTDINLQYLCLSFTLTDSCERTTGAELARKSHITS